MNNQEYNNQQNNQYFNQQQDGMRFNSTQVQNAYTPNYSTKDGLFTVLLCIFTGYLGFHRMYLGKFFTGVLYFFTLGFGGLGILYDILKCALNSTKDKNHLPVHMNGFARILSVLFILFFVLSLILGVFEFLFTIFIGILSIPFGLL